MHWFLQTRRSSFYVGLYVLFGLLAFFAGPARSQEGDDGNRLVEVTILPRPEPIEAIEASVNASLAGKATLGPWKILGPFDNTDGKAEKRPEPPGHGATSGPGPQTVRPGAGFPAGFRPCQPASPEQSRILLGPLAGKAGGWGQIQPGWSGKDDPGYREMLQLVGKAVGED